jgi:hypothetical protein
VICAAGILNVSGFALPKRFGLKNKRINSSKEGNPFWSIGVVELWICFFVACYGLRVASYPTQKLVCNILTRNPERETRNASISTTLSFAIGVAAGRFDD